MNRYYIDIFIGIFGAIGWIGFFITLYFLMEKHEKTRRLAQYVIEEMKEIQEINRKMIDSKAGFRSQEPPDRIRGRKMKNNTRKTTNKAASASVI